MKVLNHLFTATALAGLGLITSQNAIANDQDVLTQGYCGPTDEINQARQEAGLRFVFGGEADMIVYNDNGEPKQDDNGDPVFEEREYLVAANDKGEFYAFIGNADLEGSSSQFCVGLAAENANIVNNSDTPQLIPDNNETVQSLVQDELDDPVASYVFAQAEAKESDLKYTMFVTAKSDSDGKNYVIYSHRPNDARIWSSGHAGRVFDSGNNFAREYRQHHQAGL